MNMIRRVLTSQNPCPFDLGMLQISINRHRSAAAIPLFAYLRCHYFFRILLGSMRNW